ncbi:replication initiation and membrane attachment family protein [Peribacillus sp. SCS-155]|uniref:replication initiation and membrane attachment family protein n=1 Tax=Peribacillus sedimenti TaxID=3115297 RepID=UPI003906C09B
MTKHWQELLPVDRYMVSAAGLLHEYDRKIITLLYQPLIGPVCVSLYMTLWSELEENRLWSQSSLHYNLMNAMGLNLADIYSARIKLEGIGLLNVYKNKGEEETNFVYELNAPLSPEQFFTDGMLNIYLYKKVGKVQFGRLKKLFSDQVIATDQYDNVTKSFTEVFASDQLDSLYVTDEAREELLPEKGTNFFSKAQAGDTKGFDELFDFDLLLAGIKSSLIPSKAFTPKVKDTIAKLSFLYGIDVLQMQKLVIGSLDVQNEIDIEALRKAARDWYQIEYSNEMPSLIDRVQPAILQSQKNEPVTKEEQLIRHLETVSPRERLMQLSGGAEPSNSDLQIIEGIMMNQNLNPGVVNVLIEYVMLKTDMKLTKSYIEKIASHWARKKVETVKQAMDLAKREENQYQLWAQGKKDGRNIQKRATRSEIVPEWLKEENAPAMADRKQNKADKETEERKRQLEERLKKLKSRG